MPKIEDYALIGDLETAALVSFDGSVDWLCWPHFSSAACFARLLGGEENGYWQVFPTDDVTSSSRRYLPGTLVLETRHETTRGVVEVVDFMPPREQYSDVVRMVRGVSGSVSMKSKLVVRFNYGSAVPWSSLSADGVCLQAGPDLVVLRSDVTQRCDDKGSTVTEFNVAAGETKFFVLTYGTYGGYHSPTPRAIDHQQALKDTLEHWCEWSGRCTYNGPYRDAVVRSMITLKALTFRPTGGIVAAPTTSLPEQLGGTRNWDYRYCWLRDTTLTLLALMNGGYHAEAADWVKWLRRTVAGAPDQVQIMYGISGERTLTEWTASWLAGYEGAKPVRIGNQASEQLQLDIYGEIVGALHFAQTNLRTEHPQLELKLFRDLVFHLEKIWQQPDDGIWETRGERRHFTYSKVMAWVAFDRAAKLARMREQNDLAERWEPIRDTIHQEICDKAFHQEKRTFTQFYGSDTLDASVLLMTGLGFLPHDDPRIVSTIEAIERELTSDGLLMRYDNREAADDGLPPGEGMFQACSFWLVSSLKLIGRDDVQRPCLSGCSPYATMSGCSPKSTTTRQSARLAIFRKLFHTLR